MATHLLARVVLMPKGDIHIAYQNRQTYYCTPRALMLLLSDPFCFLDKGGSFLTTSSILINNKQESLDKIQGLTLLAVYSDKRIVCEFTDLFKPLYSPYFLKSAIADKYMTIEPSSIKDTPVDPKQALLFLFMEYTQSKFAKTPKGKRNFEITQETQTRIMGEILNTSAKFDSARKENCDARFPIELLDADNDSDASPNTDEHAEDNLSTNNKEGVDECLGMVTFEEFARLKKVKLETVYGWKWRGKLQTACKGENGLWMIDPNEVISDKRAGRKVEKMSDGSNRKVVRLKGSNYKDVQLYIRERGLVSDNIRRYIRTYDEAKYYEKHNYHEVHWDISNAMIIDINPDYFCKAEGKTNRQLIADDQAPVVPGSEQYKFHLHHIGQKKDSPLAIIPGYDHNDKKFYSIFHSGKSTNEDLHDGEFEKLKIAFWKAYIEQYDKYGSYSKIPFINSKHKRKERQCQ